MSERQVTLLPEIYEIDKKTEIEIQIIYNDKRSKGWSPTAACLMASILTSVPECYVQQLLKFGHKSNDSKVKTYCSFFKNGYLYGTFFNEDCQEMVTYFERLNVERRSPWRFDEFTQQKKFAKELNVKVETNSKWAVPTITHSRF